MKIPLVVAPVGLAISFALPAFAQQKKNRPLVSRTASKLACWVRSMMRKTLAIINRQQVWTVAGVLLLAVGLQLDAQQADLDAAAAAKAAAVREALSRAPGAVQGPVGTFITFDFPGAIYGTTPVSMNPAGAITGYYTDPNLPALSHGFLRASDGTFTTFDVPGAVYGTEPFGINNGGFITGSYGDNIGSGSHGFLRAPNGTFATFDAPGDAFTVTVPYSINPAGTITGSYFDAHYVAHGFLRATNGTLTTFDAPGAGPPPGIPLKGTLAVGINPEGAIVGMSTDANNVDHGFLRARDGTFTTFDPPGAIATFSPYFPGLAENLYITPDGVITGTYRELISGNPDGGNYRVFVRTRDGTFTTFDAATYPAPVWSFPSGITPAGAITGSFRDGFIYYHGFVRARNGTVTTFDVPGAGTRANQGTVPLGINPGGVIMGLYIDEINVPHGFLLLLRSKHHDRSDRSLGDTSDE